MGIRRTARRAHIGPRKRAGAHWQQSARTLDVKSACGSTKIA